MESGTIFRKTEKGKREVEARASRLDPSARRLLILIDGQRAAEELSVYVRPGELEGAIGKLLGEALIVELADAEPGRVARSPAANDPVVFAGIKIRAMTEVRAQMRGPLGPMADMLVAEINACPSALALREKLRALEERLGKLMGPTEAVALARKIGQELTKLAPPA